MFSRQSGGAASVRSPSEGSPGPARNADEPPLDGSDWLESLGHDAGLEAEGLRLLAEGDTQGCRAALGRLVTGLSLPRDGAGETGRRVAALLLDLLLQVARGVHTEGLADPGFRESRREILAASARWDSPQQALEGFLPLLNRLLALGGPGSGSVVARARRFIDANFDQRIVLSTVARRLNVSPNYLSRLFRAEIGVTLTHYIQQKRVERARALLTEGGRTMSEIAYRVGYRHYRDFYRNFVKLEGASPREIRRRLR